MPEAFRSFTRSIYRLKLWICPSFSRHAGIRRAQPSHMAKTSYTSVRTEADRVAVCPLALQLFLQLVEEAPVGALGNELLGMHLIIPASWRRRP